MKNETTCGRTGDDLSPRQRAHDLFFDGPPTLHRAERMIRDHEESVIGWAAMQVAAAGCGAKMEDTRGDPDSKEKAPPTTCLSRYLHPPTSSEEEWKRAHEAPLCPACDLAKGLLKGREWAVVRVR